MRCVVFFNHLQVLIIALGLLALGVSHRGCLRYPGNWSRHESSRMVLVPRVVKKTRTPWGYQPSTVWYPTWKSVKVFPSVATKPFIITKQSQPNQNGTAYYLSVFNFFVSLVVVVRIIIAGFNLGYLVVTRKGSRFFDHLRYRYDTGRATQRHLFSPLAYPPLLHVHTIFFLEKNNNSLSSALPTLISRKLYTHHSLSQCLPLELEQSPKKRHVN